MKNKISTSALYVLLLIVLVLSFQRGIAQEAKYFYEEGVRCRTAAKPDSAIYYFQLSADEYEKEEDWETFFDAHTRIAWVLFNNNRIAEGVSKATWITTQSRKILGTPNMMEGEAFIYLAFIYKDKSDPSQNLSEEDKSQKILENFIKGLEIFETLNRPLDEYFAECYFWVALIYEGREQWDKAITYYQKSRVYYLDRFKQNPKSGSPTAYSIENNLALLYMKTGHYQKAEEHIKHSLLLIQSWYPHRHDIMSSIYNSMGIIYETMAQLEKAELYYRRSLDLKLEYYPDSPSEVAAIYNNISIVYNKQEKAREALSLLLKAEELNASTDPTDRQIKIQREILGNLAGTYLELEDYEKTFDASQKGIELIEQNFEKDHFSKSICLWHIGSAYGAQKQYTKARNSFQEAIKLLVAFYGEKHPQLALIYNSIADTYIKEGLFDEGLQWVQKAIFANSSSVKEAGHFAGLSYLDGKEALRSIELKVLALLRLSQRNNDIDVLENTLQTIQEADTLVFKLRGFYQKMDRIAFNKTAHRIYELAINVCNYAYEKKKDKIYLEYAFRFAESARQQSLLAEINAADALHISGLPDSIIQQEFFLRQDIGFWESELWQAQQDKEEGQIAYARQILLEEKQAYEKLMDHLEKNYPDYYRLKYDFSPLQFKDAAHLLEKDQALIAYFIGDSSLFIFTLAHEEIGLQKFLYPEDLNQQVKRFLKASSDFNFIQDSTQSAAQDLTNIGHQLYALLLQPAREKIPETVKRLIIIPDGVLHLIPFELLPVTDDFVASGFRNIPYLIHDYAIAYWTSVNLNLKQKNRKKEKRLLDYAGFAPLYNPSDLNNNDIAWRNPPSALPYATEEVKACAQLLDGAIYLENHASKDTFLSLASKYKILHLAMHGFINHEEPLQSFLLFNDQSDSTKDNRLHTYELYNASINSDLVVLNACNTGAGEVKRGEGIMNMARAFAYAGCPAVMMGMWSLPDASSAELTKIFFKNLKEGLPKDVALQQAKIEFLQQTVPHQTHPVYWAGSIMVGAQDPLFKQSSWGWYLLGGFALLLLVVVFRRFRFS